MIQITVQVTLETLLANLKQLNKDELEQVAQQTAVLIQLSTLRQTFHETVMNSA